MKNKPLVISVVSFIFILLPVFYYIQLVTLKGFSFSDYGLILSCITGVEIGLLIGGIFVGFGIRRVTLVGWCFFILYAGVVFGWTIYLAVTHGAVPQSHILFFTVTVLSVIALFVNKGVRALYYDSGLQWWKHEERFVMSIPTTIYIAPEDTKVHGRTFDVSASGLFFVGPVEGVAGQKVKIVFDLEGFRIFPLTGEIVWVNRVVKKFPPGVGIRFMSFSRGGRNRLRRELAQMYAKELEFQKQQGL